MPADGIRAATFHSYGDFGSPVIGSLAQYYKGTVTIKSSTWRGMRQADRDKYRQAPPSC
jgi:hypothetical protein